MIAITSHLYRLWSGLRTQLNENWIQHVATTCTYGGLPGRSAVQASAVDSLIWDISAATEKPLYSAYLDSSRCFDCLKYDDLVNCALALGASPRVMTALLSWHKAHKRFVVVKGWIQESIAPKRGIPQGCPSSVTVCVIWNVTWSPPLAEHLYIYGRLLALHRIFGVPSPLLRHYPPAFHLVGHSDQPCEVYPVDSC